MRCDCCVYPTDPRAPKHTVTEVDGQSPTFTVGGQIRTRHARRVVPCVGVHLLAAGGVHVDHSEVRGLPVHEQQRVRRRGFRVGDGAVGDHALDLGTGEPGRPHVLFLEFSPR